MTKKIIKVEDTKETKKKSSSNGLDLGKIKEAISNNPNAVRKITEGLGEIIINNSMKSSTTKKSNTKSTKKTTKKSSSSDVTNTIKTITNLLGK